MKTAICKFPLKITATQQVQACWMQCLHVGLQNDELFVWAWVHTKRPKFPTTFHIVPTGGEPDAWWNYLGTVVQQDGSEWHVYYQENQ
jgi:hypothetical protein